MTRSSFRIARPRILARALAALACAALLAAGCSTPHAASPQEAVFEGRYEAGVPAVWEAAVQAVASLPLEAADEQRRRIETQWVEGYSRRTQGFLFGGQAYKRRARYKLAVVPHETGSRVLLNADIEERAPGGSRAFRWQRVAAQPADVEPLFDAIRRALESGSGGRHE